MRVSRLTLSKRHVDSLTSFSSLVLYAYKLPWYTSSDGQVFFLTVFQLLIAPSSTLVEDYGDEPM